MTIQSSLCSFGALALFTLTSAAANAAPAYVKSTVNLRSGAATTNEIVAKIPAGSLVEANNCSEWCEVTWQGKSGFAIKSALDTSGRVPVPHAPSAAGRRPCHTTTMTTKSWSADRLITARPPSTRIRTTGPTATTASAVTAIATVAGAGAGRLQNSDKPFMRRRTSEAAIRPQFAPCETILPFDD